VIIIRGDAEKWRNWGWEAHFEAPFNGRPGLHPLHYCHENFGAERFRIPKKQRGGASESPDPTPKLKRLHYG